MRWKAETPLRRHSVVTLSSRAAAPYSWREACLAIKLVGSWDEEGEEGR